MCGLRGKSDMSTTPSISQPQALARASNGWAASGPMPRAPSGVTPAPSSAIDDIFDGSETREKFIPVTRQALVDRLSSPHQWHGDQAQHARKLFRYLDYWRRQTYNARLMSLDHCYEAFSPDSDLLVTRKFSEAELILQQRSLVKKMRELLVQANYTAVDPAHVQLIMTPDSHYGLNLDVDLRVFDELMIFYRGATKRTQTRRSLRRLYMRHEEFEVPIFQRLFIFFKLKPEERRIGEIMADKACDRETAEKIYRRARSLLPPLIKTDFAYMKLFKNIPRSDLEMIFPNTRVRFRMFDKLKLGVTTGGSVGMGVVGAVGKLAVATNPVALAGAVIGLGGIALRQGMNFINQKNRYMVTMAQNLYFHAMADNRGVMTLLSERAAEEDVKEEMLLYAVLAKEKTNRSELRHVDRAIERYMGDTFGVGVNFDIEDALSRLMQDGLVVELADGSLQTLGPAAACRHIDMLWDQYLDKLPDQTATQGQEFDLEPEPAQPPNGSA